mgnify:CR=1 FL=1
MVAGALFPHAPVLVPEVGRGEEERVGQTRAALDRMVADLLSLFPQQAVLVSPHGPHFPGKTAFPHKDPLEGDLAYFRAPGSRVSLPLATALLSALEEEARDTGLDLLPLPGEELEYASVVPLLFLVRGGGALPLLVLWPSLDRERLFELGGAVARAAERTGKRTAVLISGDLSHRLKPDAPAGYHPRARLFDREVTRALERGEAEALMALDEELRELAGEDVLHALPVMLGALEGWEVEPKLYSYQAPYGVGYAVALWTARQPREESELVRLARRILHLRLGEGKTEEEILSLLRRELQPLPPALSREAGCFVSLKRRGKLRGCMGSLAPRNLLENLVSSALNAAEEDYRFPPVGPEELDLLTVTVDVLGAFEPVNSKEDLDPREYGILVIQGQKRALLLPDLPGIETPEEQLQAVLRKAGLPPDARPEIYRFRTERHR